MIKFILRGLPEGITGKSEAKAKSLDELLSKHPELNEIKDKLKFVTGGEECSFSEVKNLNKDSKMTYDVKIWEPCDG